MKKKAKPHRVKVAGKKRFHVIGADGSIHPVIETTADRALAAVVDGVMYGHKPPNGVYTLGYQGDDASAKKGADWGRAGGMKVRP
jgi:hypothetical protein